MMWRPWISVPNFAEFYRVGFRHAIQQSCAGPGRVMRRGDLRVPLTAEV
jgi:hypothetical protein